MCGSPERRRNLQVFWLMGEAQRETKLSDMEKEAESTQEEDINHRLSHNLFTFLCGWEVIYLKM